MQDGQDQEELFDVLPPPESDGFITDPEKIRFLMQPNRNGCFPTITRKDAHRTGAWHRAIGLWLYTPDGRVVLQKRSELKDTNPGKWQMSVAGHVSSGQSVVEAVLTEAEEELGIKVEPSTLHFVCVKTSTEQGNTSRFGEFLDREYKFLFIAPLEEQAFSFNKFEISTYKYDKIHDVFKRFIDKDPTYCPMSVKSAEVAEAAIMSKIYGAP